jgi:hypothetical protein
MVCPKSHSSKSRGKFCVTNFDWFKTVSCVKNRKWKTFTLHTRTIFEK